MTGLDAHDRQDLSGFYIHPGECAHCGECQLAVPACIRWRNAFTGDTVTEVRRQPESAAEIAALAGAARQCCRSCIYYGGTDPAILAVLTEKGVPPSCLCAP